MIAQREFIWGHMLFIGIRKLLVIIAIAIFLLCTSRFFSCRIEAMPIFACQSKTSNLDFHIVIVQSKLNDNHARIAFGYTTLGKLEKKDLIKLSRRLRKQFADDPKVRVIFFNNKEDATLYGKKLIDYTTKENVRVIYSKGISKNEEYIEYAPDPINTSTMIKLKLKS